MANVYLEDVPRQFRDKVCSCEGSREGFSLRNIPFPWWVHSECGKPAPLNATNARLYRECEFCEEFYWIVKHPDRNDVCPACDG